MEKGIRFVVTCLGLVPASFARMICFLLGAVVSLLPLRDIRIAHLQRQRFLPEAPASTVRAMCSSLLLSLFEAARLPRLVASRHSHTRCASPELLTQFRERSRPILALTAHTGNWDYLAGYMVAEGLPIHTIGRRARRSGFQSQLETVRDSVGVTTIWRDDPAAVRTMVKTFKQNGILAALIDQDLEVKGVHAPFLGTPAHYPSSLIDMARKFDALIVTCFCKRDGEGGFQIMLDTMPDGLSTEEVITLYSERLEKLVRSEPWQWVWIHKRWRTMHDGHRLSSQEYLAWLQT